MQGTEDKPDPNPGFCQCENRKEQPETHCPLDDDPCNCCAYCQDECSKLNAE